jgi:hypothetical protein
MSDAGISPPFLLRGLAPSHVDDLPRLYEFYWQICTFLQTLLEDLEGVDERNPYLQRVKLRLLETSYELDEALTGRPSVDHAHQLALAVELGCGAFSALNGVQITELFFDDLADTTQEARRMLELGQKLTASVPGNVRTALDTSGQRYILKMLRNWSKLSADSPESMNAIREFMYKL